MASPALTPSSPTLGSPLPARPAGSSHSSVDTTARGRLSPPPSPTKAPLSSAEPTKNFLLEKYREGLRLFDHGKLEDARALFDEVIRALPATDANSLFIADCKIGLAYTYSEDDSQRTETALRAKPDLDQVYDKRSAWDSLGEEQQTHCYKQLRICLSDFESLVPNEMVDLFADVRSKIEECNHHIPPLSYFYDKLAQGIDSFKAKNYDQASAFYTQALEMTEGHSEPDYLLARAFGIMHLAMNYLPGEEDHDRLALEAQVLAFEVYDRKEELFANEKSKLTALNLFCQLFEGLSQIISGDGDIPTQIKKKLEECRREHDHLSATAPTGGSSGSEGPDLVTTPPGSKVSKDPVDPWKAAKLFIAFGFAAVIIAGAFVLGRRYITRLN